MLCSNVNSKGCDFMETIGVMYKIYNSLKHLQFIKRVNSPSDFIQILHQDRCFDKSLNII